MSLEEDCKLWSAQLPPGQFRFLFDYLSGTLFFAKDLKGRLMAGNPSFIKRCGFNSESEMIGMTDRSIFPPRLAEKYLKDDTLVMTTGKPLLGIIELFPNHEGKPEWFTTNKLPLFDTAGKVCGLCGTVSSYEAQRETMLPYLELVNVADHLKTHFRDKLDVALLAEIAKMSVRQFERKFRQTFQMSPQDFLIRTRIIEACDLLARTDYPVTHIALEVGFYDHSDFARQFRRHVGQTASAYRQERK